MEVFMDKFKIGDRVVRTGGECGELHIGDTGTILSVHEYVCHVMNDSVHKEQCWGYEYMTHFDEEKQSIHIYSKGLTTYAIHKVGNKAVKSAHAKCHPNDKFDFIEGAKLAIKRLIGEEEVKETKEAGLDWDLLKRENVAVHCDTEEKANEFLTECEKRGVNCRWLSASNSRWNNYKENTCYNTNGMSHITFCELDYYSKHGYRIIEYKPSEAKQVKEVKEVKRPAKVGEWIKIVDAIPHKTQNYNDGDVLKVIAEHACCRYDVRVEGQDNLIDYCEYVVLENYTPTEDKPKERLYTKEEVLTMIKETLERVR